MLKKLVVCGVGLIGGSFALGLKLAAYHLLRHDLRDDLLHAGEVLGGGLRRGLTRAAGGREGEQAGDEDRQGVADTGHGRHRSHRS